MAAHVRLQDIATRAKVSVATVSMALRDHHLISKPTRERIIALAKKMGYRSHPYVSAYMSWRRSRGDLSRPTLALLHHYPTADGWKNHSSDILREMYRGAVDQIRVRGYNHAEFWLRSARPERLVEILKTRAISGVLFAPLAEKLEDYGFPWDDFSAVHLGTGQTGVTLPRVAHDHYRGALEAVRRCVAKGYSRPGLIFDPAHDLRLQHVWRAGFEMGAEECNVERDRIIRASEAQPDMRALKAWLKRKRPDVIITNLHRLAENLLQKVGLTAPRDVGLVSLSVPSTDRRLSGVDQNGFLIGSEAVGVLAGALQLNRTGTLPEAITTLITGRWNDGETF